MQITRDTPKRIRRANDVTACQPGADAYGPSVSWVDTTITVAIVGSVIGGTFVVVQKLIGVAAQRWKTPSQKLHDDLDLLSKLEDGSPAKAELAAQIEDRVLSDKIVGDLLRPIIRTFHKAMWLAAAKTAFLVALTIPALIYWRQSHDVSRLLGLFVAGALLGVTAARTEFIIGQLRMVKSFLAKTRPELVEKIATNARLRVEFNELIERAAEIERQHGLAPGSIRKAAEARTDSKDDQD